MTTTSRRAVRAAAGLASVGMIAGLSFFAASPALAADECIAGNSVDAATGSIADVQTLLDGAASLICLSGVFTVPESLDVKADVTLRGVGDGATLDADGGSRIIGSYDQGGDVVIDNLHLTNAGGSAVASYHSVTIMDSVFDGNTASQGGAVQAGGVITVRNSTFSDNTASNSGGAIRGYGDVSVMMSTFEDNSSGVGGAVSASGALAVVGSEFIGNSARNVGGAISVGGLTTIEGSTFENNVGAQGGAVLASGDDPVTVDNSTFVRNTGGGPVFLTVASTITTSSFLGNTTGAVFARDAITVTGNIFSADGIQIITAGPGVATDGGGNVFTGSAADETSLDPAPSSIFGANPASIFATGELADNGGATRTLALNPSGPAIGVVPAGAPLTDQRGVPRPTPADAGAFQVAVPAPVPIPIDPAATPALAETGADSSPFIALGLSLFAAAAALFAVGRRQARRSAIRS